VPGEGIYFASQVWTYGSSEDAAQNGSLPTQAEIEKTYIKKYDNAWTCFVLDALQKVFYTNNGRKPSLSSVADGVSRSLSTPTYTRGSRATLLTI
jgi:hypothetical protein